MASKRRGPPPPGYVEEDGRWLQHRDPNNEFSQDVELVLQKGTGDLVRIAAHEFNGKLYEHLGKPPRRPKPDGERPRRVYRKGWKRSLARYFDDHPHPRNPDVCEWADTEAVQLPSWIERKLRNLAKLGKLRRDSDMEPWMTAYGQDETRDDVCKAIDKVRNNR